MKRLFALMLLSGALTAVWAEDEGMPLSYSAPDPDNTLEQSVAAMQEWAQGEYEEHQSEGLFKKHPAEGRLITDMLALSRELQAQGEALKRAGDAAKARAYLFSAEASARYAAQMPHMLEHRMRKAGH